LLHQVLLYQQIIQQLEQLTKIAPTKI